MHPEIDRVDIYLGEIFFRALDHEVVWEQSQGACIGLYWLLLMFGLGRTRSKLGFRLHSFHQLRGWLRDKRFLDFLSFLFLFIYFLRNSSRLRLLLLSRYLNILLLNRFRCSLLCSFRFSSWLRLKWIEIPPRRLLFTLFEHRSLIFSGGTDLIKLIVLSVVILLVSFSLITHT